jgi:anti-sigma B factor antagonist
VEVNDRRIPYEVVNGVPIVTAPEEIDINNAPDLRTALNEAAAESRGTVVLDMTQTQFCDSSGIHTLLAVHKRVKAEGRELLLVIPDAAALRVFQITGVDNVTSREEALGTVPASAAEGC